MSDDRPMSIQGVRARVLETLNLSLRDFGRDLAAYYDAAEAFARTSPEMAGNTDADREKFATEIRLDFYGYAVLLLADRYRGAGGWDAIADYLIGLPSLEREFRENLPETKVVTLAETAAVIPRDFYRRILFDMAEDGAGATALRVWAVVVERARAGLRAGTANQLGVREAFDLAMPYFEAFAEETQLAAFRDEWAVL